ncbi:MAG: WG repeat-containing protein [Fusobacterium sp.]|nr:WG repeat-containing protein [Fusobacterium sp.]
MKRIFLLLSVIILMNSAAIAGDDGVMTYSEKNKFGLKTTSGVVVTEAIFKKLIRVGDSSWIVQKGSNFGLIDNDGNYIIQPKYKTADRLVGRFVKFGRGSLCGLWNEKGEVIVPEEYSSINLLYGKMFLVEKNFKYGLIGFDGRVILEPAVDDIYMPKPNVMRLSHNGKWYEIEQVSSKTFELPEDIHTLKENENFKITEIISNPVPSAGYGVVSASDYCLKVFSSVSPAYEQTIDELVLNHGADVAGILLKSTWLVKFPFVYGKNYINTLRTPNNGPLSEVKASLKSKIKE